MSRPFPPDFDQFRKSVSGEAPDRPVLYEHYIEFAHIDPVLGPRRIDNDNPPWGWVLNAARAFAALGYDVLGVGDCWAGFLNFPLPERGKDHSVAQYSGGLIADEASMEAYPWPEPDFPRVRFLLDGIQPDFPAGMKLMLTIAHGPFDLIIELMGFENACLAAADEPELLDELGRRIGVRQARLVEACAAHPLIGAVQVCDDWGYRTNTVLAPETLRRSVFPWHRAVVEAAHAAGKIAILHACGDVFAVMDDVITGMGYDAKHSYEDVIRPVENAWADYHGRIGVLGGIDNDFLVRSTPEAIYRRCRALVEKTRCRRYALGSGNSVTAAMAPENFQAMLRAAWDGFPAV